MTQQSEWPRCEQCNSDKVIITRTTLKKMMANKPVLKSIPEDIVNGNSATIAVCPECDQYALGAELIEPFPFTTKDGEIKTINDWYNER